VNNVNVNLLGDARCQLANGHRFLEERLSGDDNTPENILANFHQAKQAITNASASMNDQIASASEPLGAMANEIDKNMDNINQVSEDNTSRVQQRANSGAKLASVMKGMQLK